MKDKLPAASRGINQLLQGLSFAQPLYICIFKLDYTTLSGLPN